MTCPHHLPVPCRELHIAMHEDPVVPGNIVPVLEPRTLAQVITARTDGLGCPACGSFEPYPERRRASA